MPERLTVGQVDAAAALARRDVRPVQTGNPVGFTPLGSNQDRALDARRFRQLPSNAAAIGGTVDSGGDAQQQRQGGPREISEGRHPVITTVDIINPREGEVARGDSETAQPLTESTGYTNVLVEDIPKVRAVMEAKREFYREALSDVLVDRDSVDPRVIALEERLHAINEERAARYGLTYEPFEVFYIDRERSLERASEINQKLETRYGQRFDDVAAQSQPESKTILMFVNNFLDADVDAYDTASKLRHELMGHGGSFSALTAYPDGDGDKNILASRNGGRIIVGKEDALRRVGVAFDEGHMAVEDAAYRDQLDALFPGAREKFETLRTLAINGGLIMPDQMLMCYQIGKFNGSADQYDDYQQLMEKVYAGSDDMHELASGLIYGGNVMPFARRINKVFGRGFFRKLITASDRPEAQALLQEIS